MAYAGRQSWALDTESGKLDDGAKDDLISPAKGGSRLVRLVGMTLKGFFGGADRTPHQDQVNWSARELLTISYQTIFTFLE